MRYDRERTANDPPRDRLRGWIAARRRVIALTGAGCSTASGIPDYRDERGEWKRRPPVLIQAFRSEPATYRRYWARAFAGWTRFAAAGRHCKGRWRMPTRPGRRSRRRRRTATPTSTRR